MKKRILSLLLAALLLSGMGAAAAFSNQSPWAAAELETAAKAGLVPAALTEADMTLPITRAEFAAVAVKLYEVMSGTTVPAGAGTLSDTKDPEVLKACALGFANGVGGGAFAPDQSVARQDAATMLTRVYKKLHFPNWTLEADRAYPLDLGGVFFFADHDRISDWARDAVYFMSGNGVVKGDPDRNFMPQNYDGALPGSLGTATRQEAMLMSLRVMEKFSVKK